MVVMLILSKISTLELLVNRMIIINYFGDVVLKLSSRNSKYHNSLIILSAKLKIFDTDHQL